MILPWLHTPYINLSHVAARLYGASRRLHTYKLQKKLIGAMPIEGWDRLVQTCTPPADWFKRPRLNPSTLIAVSAADGYGSKRPRLPDEVVLCECIHEPSVDAWGGEA